MKQLSELSLQLQATYKKLEQMGYGEAAKAISGLGAAPSPQVKPVPEVPEVPERKPVSLMDMLPRESFVPQVEADSLFTGGTPFNIPYMTNIVMYRTLMNKHSEYGFHHDRDAKGAVIDKAMPKTWPQVIVRPDANSSGVLVPFGALASADVFNQWAKKQGIEACSAEIVGINRRPLAEAWDLVSKALAEDDDAK